jgi:uncharacterized protein
MVLSDRSKAISSSGPLKQADLLRIRNLSRSTDLATQAEVARTSAGRQKGLLGRTGLPEGGALWIVPCESVHTFFMKFPIDLVYIDRKRIVKKVRRNVVPWRLSACIFAHSIIELPVGAIDRSKTVPGDKLEFVPAEVPSAT